MAVLTSAELVSLRKASERDRLPHSHDKPEVHAAFQALEDWYQAHKADAGARIETVAPGKFDNTQKKKLGKHYFSHRFRTD